MQYIFLNNNLRIRIDEEFKVLWTGIHLKDKLYYSVKFLENLTHIKELIIYFIKHEDIKYVVVHSLNKGVWNLGGDLEEFIDCIRNQKRDNLSDYAYKCLELVYNFNSNFELDVFSSCVAQGNAFGGGFESALVGNYIISEKSAKFSFPESIFDTFPVIGGYSFLTKKNRFKKAQEVLTSGKTFAA